VPDLAIRGWLSPLRSREGSGSRKHEREDNQGPDSYSHFCGDRLESVTGPFTNSHFVSGTSGAVFGISSLDLFSVLIILLQ
jgi:hypothetical protein